MIAKMTGKLSKILRPNSLNAQFVPNFQNVVSDLNKTRNQLVDRLKGVPMVS
jgi:aspartate/tyrosine/aromatic aminotransferase